LNATLPSAVLDVGSNTIRLLVARPQNNELFPLLDQSEFVRLGKGVDATGKLDPERIQAGVEAIQKLAGEAHALGAQSVVAIATSAVRDATNGPQFIRQVREATGIETEIISGDREAYLTYLGATMGLSIESGAVVCDLGGGSAELVHANASGMVWATSAKLGSGRLTERLVHHDPPQSDELDAVSAHVVEVLKRLPEASGDTVIFTGGTATHMAILHGPYDHNQGLTLQGMDRVMEIIATNAARDLVARYRIKPERAEVLPAGITALRAIAGYYDADNIVITTRGIREGALVDLLWHAES